MCDICHGDGTGKCKAGCPNRVPEVIGTCEWCDRDIMSDDIVYELNGDLYHDECIEENAMDILEGLGARRL